MPPVQGFSSTAALLLTALPRGIRMSPADAVASKSKKQYIKQYLFITPLFV
jgi:hypothetical protein